MSNIYHLKYSNGEYFDFLNRKIQKCYLNSAARKKLEKIHAKREDEMVRSQELLRKLRKKKLEGLSQNPLPLDVQFGKKLKHMTHIRRIISLFHVKKHSQEMSLENMVTMLKIISGLFVSHPKQRELLLGNEFHCQLLQEIIQRVVSSCDQCTASQLCDSLVALARLGDKNMSAYSEFEHAVLLNGLRQFSPDEIGLVCWGFSKAGYKPIDLYSKVSAEVEAREIVVFSTTSLCQIEWAFVEKGITADRLLLRIGEEVLSRDFASFGPENLAMLGFGYSLVNIEPVSSNILRQIEAEVNTNPELKKFPTYDLVTITSALLRAHNLDRKTFRKLESVLVTRRDFSETTPKERLDELYYLIKAGPFFLAEIAKILETVLYPNVLNSVFDIFYRPRRSWKEKVLKQSIFKVY
ncbi:predicted protein [Nematostella vectensis]|uniref:Uncharacterized protein n=1 Tax=Nematostella vectensis TaxID=45351 RepID=A7SUE2_NEMVE|nr:predicted protein [Nematostella vectensis]|eukprot:XP_001624760.1 predicted protein [Nematostella vectensis]